MRRCVRTHGATEPTPEATDVASVLYRSGSVYAPGTPRASAMLVDTAGDEIIWIGTDDAAAGLGAPDDVIDLDGALIAPAFVDCHVRCTATGLALSGLDLNQSSSPAGGLEGQPRAARRAAQRTTRHSAARLGIASLHEMAGPTEDGVDDLTELLELAAAEPGPEIVAYWTGDLLEAPAPGVRAAADLGRGDPSGTGSASDPGWLGEDRLLDLFLTAADAGRQVAFCAPDAAATRRVLAAAGRAADRVGLARLTGGRHRVEYGMPTALPDIREMARLGLIAGVHPSAPPGDGAAAGASLRDLAASGVPFAFGSGAPAGTMDPWAWVREASRTGPRNQAISVRAAFAAATRGGRRAALQDDAGDLRPGAPATFAVWEYEGDLVVRTPDSRLAAWSTDPRAATPGLPDLRAGTSPRCLRTVVAGRTVYDNGRLR
jgi:predicted amidohydrolase YtcJ